MRLKLTNTTIIMVRRFLRRIKRQTSQLSFAYDEEEYYYEERSHGDDDMSTMSTSTNCTTVCPKPVKVVRFFQSRNIYIEDPRDKIEQKHWYSRNEISQFRAQFNQERKWMVVIDSIIAADGTRSNSFCGVMTRLYGNILKRNAACGVADISYAHCRKLSKFLTDERSGLEKLLVPHVTTDILAARKQHRDAILAAQSSMSREELGLMSAELSAVDRIFVQTTAVALAMVERKPSRRRLFLSSSRTAIIRK